MWDQPSILFSLSSPSIPAIIASVLTQGCQPSLLRITSDSSFVPTMVWLILRYLAVRDLEALSGESAMLLQLMLHSQRPVVVPQVVANSFREKRKKLMHA